MKTASGYAHPAYIHALAEFGKPRELSRCGGWILERQVPSASCQDAIGAYPLFACQDWSQLVCDLDSIHDDLVSLAVVPDPFGEYNVQYLQECFRDVVVPFKQHFIVDLQCPLNTFVHPHHRRYAHKALRNLHVERCIYPHEFLNDWVGLYATLTARHQITGIAVFSRQSFFRQFNVPGMVAFRAAYQGTTVGMLLWYVQGDVAYYHLGAFSNQGYDLHASFALFWSSIEYFSNCGLGWLDLGAGAGIQENSDDGLSRFKRKWSTGTRTAYFCGRIFDKTKYSKLVNIHRGGAARYFPAYRFGEGQ